MDPAQSHQVQSKMSNNDSHLLPFKAVLIECLDEQQNLIPEATASGFLTEEDSRHYLYTCWHVVTGLNPQTLELPRTAMNRRFLRVSVQAMRDEGAIKAIGGLRTFTIPLYESRDAILRPVWQQQSYHVPHTELNALGIYVPNKDAVRIEVWPTSSFWEHQLIKPAEFLGLNTSLLACGEKALIVGFPYGYSLRGEKFLTPIVLTRFIAGTSLLGNTPTVLEGFGAPGMSGGPVFVERNGDFQLFGLYAGTLYPDSARARPSPLTALGNVADVTLLLNGAWLWVHEDFVPSPF